MGPASRLVPSAYCAGSKFTRPPNSVRIADVRQMSSLTPTPAGVPPVRHLYEQVPVAGFLDYHG